MLIGGLCRHTASGSTVQKSIFQKVRFIHIFQRSGIFSKSRCQRIQSHRTSCKFLNDRSQDPSVRLIQSIFIHFQKIQCKYCHILGNFSIIFYLREIPDTFQQSIRKTRCSSGTSGQFHGPFCINLYAQNFCRSANNGAQFYDEDALNAYKNGTDKYLYPNVDFYSGIVYRALGIPENMFTVMFALARLPGWIAHWKEMIGANTKIVRPRQVYIGKRLGEE